jgi:hypothetical protein
MFMKIAVTEKMSRLSLESRERMPAAQDGLRPKSAGRWMTYRLANRS